MNKIVLAFDSFKGSASSTELADAARQAILGEIPQCKIAQFAIADGGEGTTGAICSAIESRVVECDTTDPLMRPISTQYNITPDGVAIMEMASASGLTLVEPHLRNPLVTTTYGTGEMILDAISKGCRTIILGIGGSATNDAAIGLLSALGIRFYDKEGNPTLELCKVADFDIREINPDVKNTKFIIACDVNNPFYGDRGAAHIYSPQKGASPSQVEELDAGLRNFAALVKTKLGINLQEIPGTGAAGGMGGGLLAFLNATLKPGIDTILEMIGFDKEVADASAVFTGEGRIDSQSGMGKAIGGIIKLAQKHNVPVIAIGGSVADDVDADKLGLLAAMSIQQGPFSLEDSMKKENTLKNVEKTIKQITRLISL
ncbi:MAG: glycerate kinase [Bacteroidales bacterium]|nr:glycerate kinase [Bacteroidales bacterium]